ncbi:hypothetical protein P9112_005334 [Eukaryota sp. TZLM1-RC]
MVASQRYICTIDSGTTSNRCILFDTDDLSIKAIHQIEHRQIYRQPGWVEHDPKEIIANVKLCINQAVSQLYSTVPASKPSEEVIAIGVTNQRETLVVWDSSTGEPLYNAIVWLDTRTKDCVDQLVTKLGGVRALSDQTGLPLSTYFSGVKLRWLLDNVPAVAEASAKKTLLWGTIDSWILYSLSRERVHVTDVSNASRTLLFNIKSLEWDKQLFDALDIPFTGYPEVKLSCSESYGTMDQGPLADVPFCSILGDQQSALCGQGGVSPSSTKVTYGTGAFLLKNTGSVPISSSHGLVTTIGYQFKSNEVIYCLEGSIAVAGSAIQFCRDNLCLFSDVSEVEPLARSVDEAECVFVPAFSGLFCPHWDQTARGTIVGMSQYTTKAHIVRSVLSSVAHQVCDVIYAMNEDTAHVKGLKELSDLKIDGGMTSNTLLCETQASLLNCPVYVSRVAAPGGEQKSEATALGAALAAGVGIGFWDSIEEAVEHQQRHANVLQYMPVLEEEKRLAAIKRWNKALDKARGWI